MLRLCFSHITGVQGNVTCLHRHLVPCHLHSTCRGQTSPSLPATCSDAQHLARYTKLGMQGVSRGGAEHMGTRGAPEGGEKWGLWGNSRSGGRVRQTEGPTGLSREIPVLHSSRPKCWQQGKQRASAQTPVCSHELCAGWCWGAAQDAGLSFQKDECHPP